MSQQRPQFTKSEVELAELLQKYPNISQAALGRKLGITRQGVASRLATLRRKARQLAADKAVRR